MNLAETDASIDSALETYKNALLLLPEGDVSGRATVYASVGDIKRKKGRVLEAERNYEKALAYEPGHRPSLEALWQMAVERKDWRAVALRGMALASLQREPAARVRELLVLAHTLDGEAFALNDAIRVLEAARTLAPTSDAILARLRNAYERAALWSKAVDVMDVQCTILTDARSRAELRYEQADIALARLRDESRARAFLDAALVEDPHHDMALAAYERVAERTGRWDDLDFALTRALTFARARNEAGRAFAFAMKLGAVRRDRRLDGPGALAAYDEAVALQPRDVTARALRADLLYAKGAEAEAVAELECMTVLDPERAPTYRHLFTVHTRANRTDAAWLAALVLEQLGAEELDQELLLEQYRSNGPLAPTLSLDEEAWDRHLRAPGYDPIVGTILRVIGPAAVAVRLREFAREGRRLQLDPLRRMPRHSTASIVRALAWASRVLALPSPLVYLLEEVPNDLAIAQAEEPTIVLSPAMLHGVPMTELAFVAGRHLAYFRAEHYPLVFYPTLEEITALFVAALGIALAEPEPADARSQKLWRDLDDHLDGDERGALTEAALRLAARGGRADLAEFVRSVERSAGRAGLLLGADLGAALRHVAAENRAIGGLGAAERRADLLSFTASNDHAALRRGLSVGVGARSSLVPPSPSLAPPSLPPMAPSPLPSFAAPLPPKLASLVGTDEAGRQA